MAKTHNKKRKYKVVSFKLSARQMKSLQNYCEVRHTTPTKLIKKHIRKFIEGFDKKVPEKYYVSANQLEMFTDDNKGDKSLSLF